MKRDLTRTIADISAGNGPPMLLLFGDDLEVHAACERLIGALVPEEQRGFNLERFDGRTVSWDEVEASLRTPPFFPGKKVLWIENTPYFLSREQNRELGEKVLQLWSEAKQEEAGKLLLDLLAVEGWTQEQWEQLQPGSAPSLPPILQGEAGESHQDLEALLEYCRGRGMNLGARTGSQGHRLAQVLDEGLPEWDFLLMTAFQVDRRTRLYKRLEELGLTIDLTIERDRTGKVSRDTLLDFIARRAQAAGKTVDAQARDMILARAPDDLRGLGNELEKLFLFVGPRSALRAQDVETLMTDRGEGWIFDLTRLVGERDAVAALGQLARLMSQGEHPLKLLAVLAAELRRLLSARQLLDTELRGSWRRGMSYDQFQKTVLKNGAPVLSRNAFADYMCFQRASGFSLRALRSYLEAVHETDLRLKSSGSHPRLVMERLILGMCARGQA